MAVAVGFQPTVGLHPQHAFEACSLGRSDTPPPGRLPDLAEPFEISGGLVARAATEANIRRVARTCGPRPMTTNRYAAP